MISYHDNVKNINNFYFSSKLIFEKTFNCVTKFRTNDDKDQINNLYNEQNQIKI